MSFKNKKVILCAALLLFLFFFLVFIFTSPKDTDIEIYYSYAESVMQNKVPYRDFFVVYPPLSLLPIILPGFFSEDIITYKNIFGLEMLDYLGPKHTRRAEFGHFHEIVHPLRPEK